MSEETLSLAGWLGNWAIKSPAKTFMIWEQRDLSYKRVNDAVLRVAFELRRIARDKRVVIYSHNNPAAIVVWLAAQAAKLEPVMLNREQRGPILRDVLERSGPGVIFADSEGVQEIIAVKNEDLEHISLGSGTLEELEIFFGDGESLATAESVEENETASIMFTSGTTGVSKGVIIPHGMFYYGAKNLAETWGVTSADIFHCWVPWFHVAAQQNVFSLTLRMGGTVALFPGFSLTKLWQQVVESKATIFGGFVTVLELLYAQEESPDEKKHNLRFGIAGHLPAKIKTRFEERFNVPMVDAYGMSEAEPVTIPEIGNGVPVGSCGKANPDFELQIQNSRGEKLQPNAEGQIVFKPKKPNRMMVGYLDDPERSKMAFRNGWFVTGDIGYLDDSGNLFFRERQSELIRVRGENVSPQEVETTLMMHPDIHEAAVIGVPAELGEDEIVAFILPVNSKLDPVDLQDWCKDKMAKFMIPKEFRFVTELPRTPTSKVKRSELKKLL